MVSRAFLGALSPPSFGVGFDRSEVERAVNAAVAAAVPGWDPADLDPTARVLKAVVETIWLHGEINQSQALRTLGFFAVGDDLTWLAADDGVYRRAGETDEQLYERWVEAPVLESVGTEARIKSNAFTSLAEVADASVIVRPNRQDVDLYCLAANLRLLSDDEWGQIIRFGNREDEHIMGTTIHRGNPVIRDYRIVVSGTYDPDGIDSVSLEAAMARHLVQYMDRVRMLGQAVFGSAINRVLPVTDNDNPVVTIHYAADQADVDARRASSVGDPLTGDLQPINSTVYNGSLDTGWFQMTPRQ